jgi:hypothetical protein
MFVVFLADFMRPHEGERHFSLFPVGAPVAPTPLSALPAHARAFQPTMRVPGYSDGYPAYMGSARFAPPPHRADFDAARAARDEPSGYGAPAGHFGRPFPYPHYDQPEPSYYPSRYSRQQFAEEPSGSYGYNVGGFVDRAPDRRLAVGARGYDAAEPPSRYTDLPSTSHADVVPSWLQQTSASASSKPTQVAIAAPVPAPVLPAPVMPVVDVAPIVAAPPAPPTSVAQSSVPLPAQPAPSASAGMSWAAAVTGHPAAAPSSNMDEYPSLTKSVTTASHAPSDRPESESAAPVPATAHWAAIVSQSVKPDSHEVSRPAEVAHASTASKPVVPTPDPTAAAPAPAVRPSKAQPKAPLPPVVKDKVVAKPAPAPVVATVVHPEGV